MKLLDSEISYMRDCKVFFIRFQAPEEARVRLLDAMKNRNKIRMDLSIENESPPSI